MITIFFTLSINVIAQNKRILTLEESINIALRKSYNVRSANLVLSSTRNSLKSWELSKKSRVEFTYDLPSFSRTYKEEYIPSKNISEYVDRQINKVNTNIRIYQPIISTNTDIIITNNLFRQDQVTRLKGLPNQTKKDFFNNFGIQIRQPIFTYNAKKFTEKNQELSSEKVENQYPFQIQDIIFNVTNAFYDLYKAAREVDIAEAEVKQQEQSYNMAQNKYKAGIIAEVDALKLEVDLAASKNNLRTKRGLLKRKQDDFKLLIGLETDEEIQAVGKIEYKPIEVDLNKAISEALKRRYEIRNLQIDIELQKMAVRQTMGRREFKASINANIGYNGNSNRLRGAFEDFVQSQIVSINFEVPIWDWGSNKASVNSAKDQLELKKLNLEYKKKSIINEVKKAVDRVNEAKERLQILKKSEELAQKSFDISLERFNNGDITSEDLALAQKRLTQAKTDILNAQIDYLVSISDLKRKTFWDFEKNKPVEIDIEKILR